MKVLHVIESLGMGGAERLLVTLLPRLRAAGDEVAVAVLRGPMDLEATLVTAGIPVIHLPSRAKWNFAGLAMDVARCVRANAYDIVHAHLYFPSVAVALSRLLRLHAARTVVTFHNLAYAPGVNKPGLGLRVRRLLATALFPRGFDVKLAVSHAVARHYCEAIRLQNIQVLHNAVDPVALDRLAFSTSPRQEICLQIVVPGRLVPEKGHEDLLAALEILAAEGKDVRAILAGGGPLHHALESAISLRGLTTRVTITGPLEHGQLLRQVAGADIVVIPSRAEGFGLAAVEAMALRRPVIVTAVGGLPEVLQDGTSGMVVPSRSPAALAEAIRTLALDASLRRRLGEGGRRRVEECFALVAAAARLQGIYQCLRPAPDCDAASALPHSRKR